MGIICMTLTTHYTLLLVLFINCLTLQNCASISMSEYQDAATLGKNNLGFMMGVTSATYYAYGIKQIESGKNVKLYIPEILEIRCQYGLAEKIDIGISAWSGLLIYNTCYYMFNQKKSPWDYDYGYKAHFKYLLNSNNDVHQWSFMMYGLQYWMRDDNDDESYVHFKADGIIPVVIYSYNFDNRKNKEHSAGARIKSIYSGIRMNILYYEYRDQLFSQPIKHFNKREIFPNIFIGVNISEQTGFTSLETTFTTMKDPFISKMRHSVSLGVGKTFVFNL